MNALLDSKQNKKTISIHSISRDRPMQAFKKQAKDSSSEARQGEAARPEAESLFRHDFSRLRAHSGLPEMPRPSQTASCALFPRSCPTGGVCHTCPARVQPRLTVNRPGDKYEQEAERVAAQVLQTPASGQSGRPAAPTPLSGAAENLQRLAHNPASSPAIPPGVQEALAAAGRPLDAAARAFMEPRFGRDFSGVRVHADARAAQSARALGAQAYTVGRDIVFGAGRYQPSATQGRRLLTHELAHVVQQQGSTGQRIQRQTGGAPAPAPSRPEREERFGIGRGGNRFDAELNRRDCLLTLKMKVAFNFVPLGGANTPEAWPSPAVQQTWQQNFIRTVTNRWSFRYYLEPDTRCTGETCQRAYARVQVHPVTSNPHFTVNASYTTDFEGSSVGRNPVSPAVGRSATLDTLDVNQRADIPQVPAEHEFGHMLGLPHVHCDTNDPVCYGVNAREQANIMGQGSIVSERDYGVFAEALNYFNGCNWHATHGSPTSGRPVGDFPVPSGDTRLA